MLEIAGIEGRFEEAFNRERKKSAPLTPEFVQEVLNELKNGKPSKHMPIEISKPRTASKSMQPQPQTIGVQTRGITTRKKPEKLIEEEMEEAAGRRGVKDNLMKQCLKEAIMESRVYGRPIPKKYSMVILETKSKVFRFKSKEILEMSYLVTPEQELAFEKRLQELSGKVPEEGKDEAGPEIRQGMMIVGEDLGIIG